MTIHMLPGSHPAITGGYRTEIVFGGRTIEFQSLTNGVRGIGISDTFTVSLSDGQLEFTSGVLGEVHPVNETIVPMSTEPVEMSPDIKIPADTYLAVAGGMCTVVPLRGKKFTFCTDGTAVKGMNISDEVTVIYLADGRMNAHSRVLGRVTLKVPNV